MYDVKCYILLKIIGHYLMAKSHFCLFTIIDRYNSKTNIQNIIMKVK